MRTGKSNSKMARHALVTLALLMLGTRLPTVHADAVTKDYAVLVEAAAVASPPSIALSWPLETQATGYQIFRKLRADTTWGTALAEVPGTATSWTDKTVSIGVKYEYQVIRSSTISAWFVRQITASPHGISHAVGVAGPTNDLSSLGYVCAGINIPAVDHRGTVVLVVDDTMAAPLSSELTRLRDDLVGDGWSVIRHDVARTDKVTAVKALIKTDYDAAPNAVTSVFLFGHVPVPRSGDIAPAGHPDVHQGAFPADLYYGDMDGVWTDNSVNDSSGKRLWDPTSAPVSYWNVPGDGKFDQSYVPPGSWDAVTKAWVPGGQVELQVGRVDLWGLTSFAPKTETDLLRQYLDKDHAHRHAITVMPRRALITDRFGAAAGIAYAQSGWRAWSSLFGAANVSEGYFDQLNAEHYLGYYFCGGGYNNSCERITTANIAQQDPKAAFWMMFGSHFGDWNFPENIFRAPLATSCGLTNVFSGKPFWYLHTMALGGTIGEAAQLVQNNRVVDFATGPLYGPAQGAAGEVHIALMGDPTLRLHAVAPVTNVAATNGTIGWTASPDTVVGYHVYRSASPTGPFTRMTKDPVTGTSFTDATVTTGTCTYMVRAIKLETSAGGTYYNSSQGICVTTTYPSGSVAPRR